METSTTTTDIGLLKSLYDRYQKYQGIVDIIVKDAKGENSFTNPLWSQVNDLHANYGKLTCSYLFK